MAVCHTPGSLGGPASLAAGVFGHGLGALRHGVLGEFAWQQKPHCSLDLPAGDGGTLVVVSKAGSLRRDALEDVVDEAVHDGHGLAANARVRVHLPQDLKDERARTHAHTRINTTRKTY
ncbi:hypothetical protein BaRGS_00037039 [Batillaria attramentaria]|uniref:Uncharacterized protein n=1 Tax=Batillaria attramentaria TaxID=370345 RepID=A0ABD0JA78_9CAEN